MDTITVTLPIVAKPNTVIYSSIPAIIPEPYYTAKTVSRWEVMDDGGYIYTEKPIPDSEWSTLLDAK